MTTTSDNNNSLTTPFPTDESVVAQPVLLSPERRTTVAPGGSRGPTEAERPSLPTRAIENHHNATTIDSPTTNTSSSFKEMKHLSETNNKHVAPLVAVIDESSSLKKCEPVTTELTNLQQEPSSLVPVFTTATTIIGSNNARTTPKNKKLARGNVLLSNDNKTNATMRSFMNQKNAISQRRKKQNTGGNHENSSNDSGDESNALPPFVFQDRGNYSDPSSFSLEEEQLQHDYESITVAQEEEDVVAVPIIVLDREANNNHNHNLTLLPTMLRHQQLPLLQL